MIFENAVALRLSACSSYDDASMRFAIFSYNSAIRDELKSKMGIMKKIKSDMPEAYWIDAACDIPWIVCTRLYDELYELVEDDGIAYVPFLDVRDDHFCRLAWMSIRIDENSVKWKFSQKHSSATWETERFTEANMDDYLSPVRFLIDRCAARRGVDVCNNVP